MTTAGGRRASSYVAALDGLRAIAVIAVVAYHASLRGAPGGFFGVDVFFVISGYLLTSQILDRAALPTVDHLRDFWRRRLLRLVPAAAAAVAVTVLVFLALNVRSLSSLLVEAAGALGYVANWLFIVRDQSYFETATRPSPFLHFWSLALEAQFYLVWPLVIWVAMRGGGRLTLFLATISLAAVSTVVGAGLYDPASDPSRGYYGTDARAVGLLAGAALGVIARPGLSGGMPRMLAEALGWGGLLVLFWMVTRGSEFDPFTYNGGFLVASVATLAVMLAALHHRNLVAAVLSVAPLRWIGLRAYSIYLWHWPVVVLTQPHLSSALQSWNLALARFAATLILAEISFRLVEHRFRSRRTTGAERETTTEVAPWTRRPAARWVLERLPRRVGTGVRSPWAAPAGIVAVALVAIAVAGGLPIRGGSTDVQITVTSISGPAITFDEVELSGPSLAAPPPVEPVSPASRVELSPETTLEPASEPTPVSEGGTNASTSVEAPEIATPPPTVEATPQPPVGVISTPTTPDVAVTMIGDSVMVAAIPALASGIPGLYVDAEVGRQFRAAADLVRSMRAQGTLGDVVVIHLGSNGPFTSEQFEALLSELEGTRGVVFVNVTVPRRWEADVNNALAAQAAGRPGVALADWHAASNGVQGYFASDGVHLTTAGQQAYAALIQQQIGALLAD